MSTYFNGTGLPDWYGSFNNQSFGGYVVSGTRYFSEICISGRCVAHRVYSGDVVSQNYWMWN